MTMAAVELVVLLPAEMSIRRAATAHFRQAEAHRMVGQEAAVGASLERPPVAVAARMSMLMAGRVPPVESDLLTLKEMNYGRCF